MIGLGPGSRAGNFGPELAQNGWKSGIRYRILKDLAILLQMGGFSAIFVRSGPETDHFSCFYRILVSDFLWLERFPGHQPGQKPLLGLH